MPDISKGIELGVTVPPTPQPTTSLNTCTIAGAQSRNTDGDYDTPGTACIFPWYHSGAQQWYTGCADPSNGYDLWCPTEINCDGTYEKWGYCESSCLATTTTTSTTTTTTTSTTTGDYG